MKRFKELSASQKREAIDYLFKRTSREVLTNVLVDRFPTNIQQRLKEIKEELKFCGCNDCFNKYYSMSLNDSQIKEWILDQATKSAEVAFYPDKDDDLIVIN